MLTFTKKIKNFYWNLKKNYLKVLCHLNLIYNFIYKTSQIDSFCQTLHLILTSVYGLTKQAYSFIFTETIATGM